MAAITVKRNASPSLLKPLLSFQSLYNTVVSVKPKPEYQSDSDFGLISEPGGIDISKWVKMDSRSLGITHTMIPSPTKVVLKILQSTGFEAYLVGGCVRDLLLKRAPKDFDVITTADLSQIREQFHRCEIVGRRFPVCRVHMKGSVIEVSSFQTLAQHTEEKENFLVSQMPAGCEKADLVRWKNSMHRDFTVNSLFFDPFAYKIYDYNNGMADLLELKLQTLVPAHLSFSEDCARILRGLRIAARLGLSLSEEIKIAISENPSSILRLSQARILMEVNYMLSFGAAESSLSLLHKYHLLEILLPFQAAYISQQATSSGEGSMMLMRLFFHLDKLVTCDQPSHCRLWIGLLAFHLALVNNPQHPAVVTTFASLLYHQHWDKGLQFARQCVRAPDSFTPEILEPNGFISDDELAQKVNRLALLVVDSIDVLADTDSLNKTMARFPGFPCCGLVFISKNTGQDAAQLFNVLVHKVESYKKGRTSFQIDYDLLGKGDSSETRFTLGKIILNTMGCGFDQDDETVKDKYQAHSGSENGHVMDKQHRLFPSTSKLHHGSAPKNQNLIAKLSSIILQSRTKNEAMEKTFEVIEDRYEVEQKQEEVFSRMHFKAPGTYSNQTENHAALKLEKVGVSQSPMEQLFGVLERNSTGNKISSSQLENPKEERVEEGTGVEQREPICPSNSKLQEDGTTKNQNLISNISGVIQNSKKQESIKYQVKPEERKEEVSKMHPKVLGTSSNPKTQDMRRINAGDSLCTGSGFEDDHAGVGDFSVVFIQGNCNKAIEEAKDSPADLKKLNQFLVDFAEKQVQRKKARQMASNWLAPWPKHTDRFEDLGSELQPVDLVKKQVQRKKAKETASSWVASWPKQMDRFEDLRSKLGPIDFVEKQVQIKEAKQTASSWIAPWPRHTDVVDPFEDLGRPRHTDVVDPFEDLGSPRHTDVADPFEDLGSELGPVLNGTSQVEYTPQDPTEPVKTDTKQLESSSLVTSSTIDTSQVESMPQTCVQDTAELIKTRGLSEEAKEIKSSVEMSTGSTGKKQKTCSYCKELGHNRLGCPKRKLEEAARRVNSESI